VYFALYSHATLILVQLLHGCFPVQRIFLLLSRIRTRYQIKGKNKEIYSLQRSHARVTRGRCLFELDVAEGPLATFKGCAESGRNNSAA
jgi:hypothetical protein